MAKKVQFSGSVAGAVTLRRGESPSDAVIRVEAHLRDMMARQAKRYSLISDNGTAAATDMRGPAVTLAAIAAS